MSRPEILGNIDSISKREIDRMVLEAAKAAKDSGTLMTEAEKLRRLKAFDEEMRKRFGPRWAPPVPVSPEDADPAAAARVSGAGAGVIRTKPNRTENEFMLNLMILRNALVRMGPSMQPSRRNSLSNWKY